jgi:hypothetical protein
MRGKASAAASSWKTVHELHWYAAKCIRLSEECTHDFAKRVFRQLAADLLFEAEKQRASIRKRRVAGDL